MALEDDLSLTNKFYGGSQKFRPELAYAMAYHPELIASAAIANGQGPPRDFTEEDLKDIHPTNVRKSIGKQLAMAPQSSDAPAPGGGAGPGMFVPPQPQAPQQTPPQSVEGAPPPPAPPPPTPDPSTRPTLGPGGASGPLAPVPPPEPDDEGETVPYTPPIPSVTPPLANWGRFTPEGSPTDTTPPPPGTPPAPMKPPSPEELTEVGTLAPEASTTGPPVPPTKGPVTGGLNQPDHSPQASKSSSSKMDSLTTALAGLHAMTPNLPPPHVTSPPPFHPNASWLRSNINQAMLQDIMGLAKPSPTFRLGEALRGKSFA